MRTLTLCWLALLALAVAGVLLGGAGDSPWLLAAVVGQRVDGDRGVLARLHHFVQVADTAFAHCAGP